MTRLAGSLGFFFCCSLLLMAAVAPAAEDNDQNITGLQLAQRVYDRPKGQDASARVVMSLQSEKSDPRLRLLYSYAKDKGTSQRWTLMRFMTPADIEGTGLLTRDSAGADSEQWLYLPALDRVRRISSSRRGGRFVGSDFFYEDLRDREVAKDEHTLIGKERIGDIECYQLESVPVDSDNSVYSRRVSWIHPELLIPLRIDYYTRGSDQAIKRMTARKIGKVQGYWTVYSSRMQNLKTGHTTHLDISQIVYDQSLPDNLFSHQALADDSAELAFRPQGS
ncbi:outer membrane lipoprotein-sorting protein [Seongchinamella sediminis]|uniref:Outer membrane lipoprotein-sorting protein n=1 Tax=Seongchinamella sediminis TaxID=2283635 RepID=A0A3L7DVW2_9GAMM|nr:outer membrane lipoprotein-sorting protein [Seongchinamella sediminis]RLQ20740.1 outer membrane lipoprotein-sorting protein [Seongchinamella sediminis]